MMLRMMLERQVEPPTLPWSASRSPLFVKEIHLQPLVLVVTTWTAVRTVAGLVLAIVLVQAVSMSLLMVGVGVCLFLSLPEAVRVLLSWVQPQPLLPQPLIPQPGQHPHRQQPLRLRLQGCLPMAPRGAPMWFPQWLLLDRV